MNKYLCLLVFIFITACGSKKVEYESVPDSTPEEIVELKVGNYVTELVRTELKYIAVDQGVPRIRTLSFKAPYKGHLYLAKPSFGLAYGCANKETTFFSEASYTFKDMHGRYSIKIKPEANIASETVDAISMEENQELRINLSIVSDSTCSQVLVDVSATFVK